MMWVFLIVLFVGLMLILEAPFIDFLVPDDTVILYDLKNGSILAKGVSTIWFHWQSWGYIALFCIALIVFLGVISYAFRSLSDRAIIQAKQSLEQKTEELEQLKREYRREIEQDVQRKHADKEASLKQKERHICTIKTKAEELEIQAHNWAIQTRHTIKRSKKETQSKLGQRDRLSEQKRLIAEFLNETNWTFNNGEKVTYSALLKIARHHHNRQL